MSPFVVPLSDFFVHADRLHLVLDAPGNATLEDAARLAEPEAASVLAQGLEVLGQLHGRGLSLHGLVCPALWVSDRVCPLGALLSPEAMRTFALQPRTTTRMDLNVLHFVPPESRKRLLDDGPLDAVDDKAADVWALGATVFWALTGVNAGAHVAEEALGQLSGPANNLLRKMLYAEPSWRIQVSSAQQHKFLRGRKR